MEKSLVSIAKNHAENDVYEFGVEKFLGGSGDALPQIVQSPTGGHCDLPCTLHAAT